MTRIDTIQFYVEEYFPHVAIMLLLAVMVFSVTMCAVEVNNGHERDAACRDACYPTVSQSGPRFCACANGRVFPNEGVDE